MTYLFNIELEVQQTSKLSGYVFLNSRVEVHLEDLSEKGSLCSVIGQALHKCGPMRNLNIFLNPYNLNDNVLSMRSGC